MEYWGWVKFYFPQMVALDPDVGVAVNTRLYRKLAKRDAPLWKFGGLYQGGVPDPESEALGETRETSSMVMYEDPALDPEGVCMTQCLEDLNTAPDPVRLLKTDAELGITSVTLYNRW